MHEIPHIAFVEARERVESLSMFIRRHAEAVDGRARAELNAQADVVDRWAAWLAERVRLDSATEIDLVGLISEIAGAGSQALQVLGGRPARNERWG